MQGTPWQDDVEGLLPGLVELRRELHRRPETAYKEEKTAARLQGFLKEHGVDVVATGLSGHGFLARVASGRKGPRLLLRADLDALPLKERSGVPHASENEGSHHACGHDGHMAMLAGALVLLARHKGAWRGTLHALFQPAEETGEGAEDVLEEEALQELEIDRTYAFHNLPGEPLGLVGVRDGVAAVASTGITVRYKGATSHASEPHRGRNPIPALASLVHETMAAPAVCLPYGAPALATLVHVEAGGPRFGTSAGRGHLSATLRADTDDDLEQLVEHVRRRAMRLADAHGLDCRVRLVEPFPATVNNDVAAGHARAAARAIGLETRSPARPQPWSEDYGHVTRRWPGALVVLGAGEEHPALHSPEYDFPDDLIGPGVRLWCAMVAHEAD